MNQNQYNTILTEYFSKYVANKTILGEKVDLTEFVFLNLSDYSLNNLNIRSDLDTMQQYIVHRQPVSKAGLINQDSVAYSVTMGTDVGDFTFNAIALLSAENKAAVFVRTASTDKVRNKDGIQGNSLTRNILLEFAGAADQTQINVSADTWQIDFTARLNGIEDDIRKINLDLYGDIRFFDDGFLAVKKSQKIVTIKSGVGYVKGYRIELEDDYTLAITEPNSAIYLDVVHQGSVTSKHETTFEFDTIKKDDYVDSAGYQHHIIKLCDIDNNWNVIDYRIYGKNITELELSSPEGAKYFGECDSVKQLRYIEPTKDGQKIYLKGIYSKTITGGGFFYSDFKDLSSPDDNFNCIVTPTGKRWKRANLKGKTKIKYERFNDIDIIQIEINNANPQNIRKVFANSIEPNGSILKLTPKEFYKKSGHKIIINADGFQGPNFTNWLDSEYGVPGGIQIVDGKLIKDWAEGDFYSEALIYLNDGTFQKSKKGDGITGEEWIDRGAIWSACFAGFMIENGNINQQLQYGGNMQSARTAICQKKDGTILIVLTEGKSHSYGFTIPQLSNYLHGLGCQMAYCLDGGGSTQVWWKNTYAMHSSDNSFKTERAIPSYLIIDVDDIDDFDSGWQTISIDDDARPNSSGADAVRWRQTGKSIKTELNVAITLKNGVYKKITKESFPAPRRAYSSAKMKCIAVGEVGKSVGVFTDGDDFTLSAIPHGYDALYLVGELNWIANNSN